MFKGQKFTYLETHEVKPAKPAKKSKHVASKKGHKHQHNLSKGQKKSAYKSLVREALKSETPIENEIERFSELK